MKIRNIFQLNKKKYPIFLTLLLISTLLSNLNIFGYFYNSINPEYFLALFIANFLIEKKQGLFQIFFFGICVDLLISQLLGLYALTFLLVFLISFILKKYFSFTSIKQDRFLNISLIITGILSINIILFSYGINEINTLKIIIEFILTYIFLNIYKPILLWFKKN